MDESECHPATSGLGSPSGPAFAVDQARPVIDIDPAVAVWRSDATVLVWLESLKAMPAPTNVELEYSRDLLEQGFRCPTRHL